MFKGVVFHISFFQKSQFLFSIKTLKGMHTPRRKSTDGRNRENKNKNDNNNKAEKKGEEEARKGF